MDPAATPTARALQALLLLQDHPGITATRLGERLGVTERAARRYVTTLRDAGVPIVSERGPYGGYRLGRGLRLPPLSFSAAEALGLVMAVLDGHHAVGDGADPADPVGSALAKLVRALPTSVAAQADAVRRSAAAAPDRGAVRPDAATTASLIEACTAGRRVALGYRTGSGTAFEAEVDPWAVVVRHGRWYLLCHDHRVAGTRAYRVDRVVGVRLLEAPAAVPVDLDPVAELEAHLAVGWEHPVRVRVEASADAVRCHLPPSLGRLEPDPEHPGGTVLTGSTNEPRWYAAQLAALSEVDAPFRVDSCEHLRARVADLGARLAAAAARG